MNTRLDLIKTGCLKALSQSDLYDLIPIDDIIGPNEEIDEQQIVPSEREKYNQQNS